MGGLDGWGGSHALSRFLILAIYDSPLFKTAGTPPSHVRQALKFTHKLTQRPLRPNSRPRTMALPPPLGMRQLSNVTVAERLRWYTEPADDSAKGMPATQNQVGLNQEHHTTPSQQQHSPSRALFCAKCDLCALTLCLPSYFYFRSHISLSPPPHILSFSLSLFRSQDTPSPLPMTHPWHPRHCKLPPAVSKNPRPRG